VLPAKAIEKRVAEGLERDERWKIIVRKNNWLCPYCGRIGARDLQMDEAIETKIAEHFLKGSCEKWSYFEAEPLPIERLRLLAKLIVFKVRLGRWVGEEKRFRFFDADDRWICPYCVKESDVPKPPSALETGIVVPEEEPFIAGAAKHLLECPEFAKGEEKIKPLRDLEERRAKQARRSRTERIKDRFRREPAWRLADGERRWLCPFCVQLGEIRLEDPTGEPPPEFLEAVEAHLVLCKAFSTLEGRPRPVEQLKERLASVQKTVRLQRIKDKILRHAVWRARDLDGVWYCPYCSEAQAIRYPADREAAALDRFVERVADHLGGCATYKRGAEIKSKAFLSDMLAKANASLEARRFFRKKLVDDPVFGVTDEVDDWTCPYCKKVQKAIHIYASHETAVFEKTVEQVVSHLQDECEGFTPDEMPRVTRAELERIARPANTLRASGIMEARIVARPKSDDEWARLKKDVAEVRERVELAKRRDLSMKEARSKQLRMLPSVPTIPGYEFGCVYKPCEDVGGDFYDFIKVDETRIGLAIGDIAGHGIEAALLMGLAKKLLEVHGRGRSSAAEALVLANADVFPDLDERTFVTVFYGVLEIKERLLRFSRAGHNPLILYNRDRRPSLQIHDSKGMALGMDAGPIFRESIEELELALRPGDLLVQYTDGVTEAMNGEREEFGLRRLSRVIEEHGHNEVEYVLWRIEKAIEEWTGGAPQTDDVTMIAVKVTG
jgi:serine phosphatase RsbU (regulator of sigma subunit)/rubredoxin